MNITIERKNYKGKVSQSEKKSNKTKKLKVDPKCLKALQVKVKQTVLQLTCAVGAVEIILTI